MAPSIVAIRKLLLTQIQSFGTVPGVINGFAWVNCTGDHRWELCTHSLSPMSPNQAWKFITIMKYFFIIPVLMWIVEGSTMPGSLVTLIYVLQWKLKCLVWGPLWTVMVECNYRNSPAILRNLPNLPDWLHFLLETWIQLGKNLTIPGHLQINGGMWIWKAEG